MRKLTITFVAAFLMVLGLSTNLVAQDGIEFEVDMEKSTSSSGESYDVQFGVSGEDLSKAKTVKIGVPKGKNSKAKKWMNINNPLGLDEIEADANGISWEELQKRFPEGEYSIKLTPKKYGSKTFNVTYNFPPTPVITYPADGATGVPLNPTITWEALSEITHLSLNFEGGGDEFDFSLPINSTSFDVPAGLLKPNTQYELSLETFHDINNFNTDRSILFTTGA